MRSPTAFWWLDNGQKLAYAQYDNSAVDRMPVVIYGVGVPGGDSDNVSRDSYLLPGLDGVYPKIVEYPYPKPGRTNPTVSVWVTDLTSPIAGVGKQVTPPKEILSV